MNNKQKQVLREKLQALREERAFNNKEIDGLTENKELFKTRNDEINAEILEIKEGVE